MAISIVMTGTARSCTLTSGSNSMIVSNATGLVVGATVQGAGVPTGTRIGTINGTTVTMVTAAGTPSNATLSGAQNLIFSSVYGSTLTIQLTASGDVATWTNVFNAGFGLLQGTKCLFHPGALTVQFGSIVAGARFDHQDWTVEIGSGGRLLFDSGLLAGEQRGGYDVAGELLVKGAGPTFVFTNWNNGTPGGSSLFTNTGGLLTSGGLFRMHNPRFIMRSLNVNAAFSFYSIRDVMDVENLILDYSEHIGANAFIGFAYGTILNTKIINANSGFSSGNSTAIGNLVGLQYLGIFNDSPAAKFSIQNNYVMEGYAPQVTNTQTIAGFQSNSTETFANIDLSTPGWNLNDLKTKYLRYGGPNTINFPRRVTFEFNDSIGLNLPGVTLYIRSAAGVPIVNAIQVGDYNANTQALVSTWGPTGGYRVATSIIDTIDQVARVRKYGYIEQTTNYSLNLDPYSQPFFMLSDVALSSIDETTANAISTVEVDFPNKLIKITGVANLRQSYAKCQVELAKPANSNVDNFIVTDGDSVNVFGGWSYQIGPAGILNASTTLKQFKVDGKQVVLSSGGIINVPYQDADGLRVTVTNLDPEGFGITWFLRHRPTGGSTWTNVSGTENTASILLAEGSYDFQIRAPGYEWESMLILNTDISLTLNAGLRYHVSSNNTPQYLMPYNQALDNIFQYNTTTMKVSVTNTTNGILSPGFAELYQATQRIQHLPTLVWFWTSPVTANATSQKILIPTGNPISMYLTDDSTNSVKITCPVIHADTGESADDRVRGNASGFSIILGSPATAESAGLQASIVAALGGTNYDRTTQNLALIKSVLDLIKSASDSTKTSVEALPKLTDIEASTVLSKEVTAQAAIVAASNASLM